MRLTPGQFQALSKRHGEQVKADLRNDDYRAAQICWAILEPQRDKKLRGQAYKPEDFMPKREPPKKQTPEQQTAFLGAIFGGGKK